MKYKKILLLIPFVLLSYLFVSNILQVDYLSEKIKFEDYDEKINIEPLENKFKSLEKMEPNIITENDKQTIIEEYRNFILTISNFNKEDDLLPKDIYEYSNSFNQWKLDYMKLLNRLSKRDAKLELFYKNYTNIFFENNSSKDAFDYYYYNMYKYNDSKYNYEFMNFNIYYTMLNLVSSYYSYADLLLEVNNEKD